MPPEKRAINILDLIVLLLVAAAGVAVRLWLASRGHNYDMESWQGTVRLFSEGKNVYVHTFRHPYGPTWFLILDLLLKLHNLLPLQWIGPESFHVVVAGFLSLADIAVALILLRFFGFAAAAFFVINPVLTLLTGWHSQIETLALVGGLGAWLIIRPREGAQHSVSWKRLLASSAMLGVSLTIKHVLIFFPIWLLMCPALIPSLRRRITYAAIAFSIFAASFVPFLFAPEAPYRIYKHVIRYRGYDGTGYSVDSLLARVVEMVTPASAAESMYGFGSSGLQLLFIACVLFTGRIVARRAPHDLFTCYLLAMPIFAALSGDQYLAVPLITCAIYYSRWPVWIYTVVASAIIYWSAYKANVFTSLKPWWHPYIGTGFHYNHAVIWLVPLLIWIISGTSGCGSVWRNIQIGLDLRKHRRADAADVEQV